jgi:glycogen operon protein
LDVVFNHSGESDVGGPTLSMRGLDNRYYYQHDDEFNLINDTGCGNTLACKQSGVVQLVMDSLRYWVQVAGVAGFRFDLAPVLGRMKHGFDTDAPLLAAMRQDPVLNKVLLIAEPWDIGVGGYQFGHFGAPWLEWNDQYRDDVRRFWHGTGFVSEFATRLAGSSDVFSPSYRAPLTSVNFITAHDGFCLRDLVSYHEKHNWANGEDNRDGRCDNISWNNGTEGETSDEHIISSRRRDVRALLATLFFSQGTVMITAGDELGKTQSGNNNAYAQDNATTWIDWFNKDHELIAFVAQLAKLRHETQALHGIQFLTADDVTWLRPDGQVMNEHDWHNNSLTLGMRLHAVDGDFLVWFNASQHDVNLTLPDTDEGAKWQLVLSSAQTNTTTDETSVAPQRSVLVLQSRL